MINREKKNLKKLPKKMNHLNGNEINDPIEVNKDKFQDNEIFNLISKEKLRQREGIELIASENFTSREVMLATGSILTNKYAEGYPGKRYYGGCEYVDVIEELAQKRVKKLFNANFANVQPHSGSQANMAVLFSFLNPGDKILAMNLNHGGHLTHGYKLNFSGMLYDTHFYGVSKESETIDYDEVMSIAKQVRPKLIIAGASAYSRFIDFAKFREIANEVNSLFMVDMAHISGLVAAKLHQNPVNYADFVTSTTHKTLRGPRGGFILTNNEEYSLKINRSLFPGVQGGPLMHVIAGKAICFKEALEPSFIKYQEQVLKNTQVLSEELKEKGFRIVSNGTDNHLFLVDLSSKGIKGNEAESLLYEADITVNKNAIPFDQEKAMVTSGIRIGCAAVTTRGMNEDDMKKVAEFISEAVQNRNVAKIRKDVHAFTARFKY